MGLDKTTLKALVDEVVYPVEQRLIDEMKLSPQKSVEVLRQLGFLRVAAWPLLDEKKDINELKAYIEKMQKIYALPIEDAFVKELLGYFCDLLKHFLRQRGLQVCQGLEAFEASMHSLKAKETQEGEAIEEEDDFFDLDDGAPEEINRMHYDESQKIDAATYMAQEGIDEDLIADMQELIERFEAIEGSFEYLDEAYVQEMMVILEKFISIFMLSGEFKDLAEAIGDLYNLLPELAQKGADEKMLKLLIDAVMEDLIKWFEAVVVEQSARDIHYLDASLLSSVEQIKIITMS